MKRFLFSPASNIAECLVLSAVATALLNVFQAAPEVVYLTLVPIILLGSFGGARLAEEQIEREHDRGSRRPSARD